MKARAHKRWLHHTKAAHGWDRPFIDVNCEECRTLGAAAGAKVPPRTVDQKYGIDLDFSIYWPPEGVRLGVQDDVDGRVFVWTHDDYEKSTAISAVLDRHEVVDLHAALGAWLEKRDAVRDPQR